MSKTTKRNIKRSSNNSYEDGYHSKQRTKADINRKLFKQFDNALRARDLKKMIIYEDQL